MTTWTLSHVTVATVDPSWSGRGWGPDEKARPSKWHIQRSEDRALALCSRRIILNTEDRTPIDRIPYGEVCGRCRNVSTQSTDRESGRTVRQRIDLSTRQAAALARLLDAYLATDETDPPVRPTCGPCSSRSSG